MVSLQLTWFIRFRALLHQLRMRLPTQPCLGERKARVRQLCTTSEPPTCIYIYIEYRMNASIFWARTVWTHVKRHVQPSIFWGSTIVKAMLRATMESQSNNSYGTMTGLRFFRRQRLGYSAGWHQYVEMKQVN